MNEYEPCGECEMCQLAAWYGEYLCNNWKDIDPPEIKDEDEHSPDMAL